jgi:aminoacrylate hydrolase
VEEKVLHVDIGGFNLSYRDEGEGDPLLFIPGLIGLMDAWDFQVPHFSRRYRCLRFDHRGSGGSDRAPDGRYSTKLIAEDVVRLLDRLEVERVYAVGASTGGCILQNLALDHPQRLRACVFTNTWTTADEYIKRLQTSRMRILQSYGPDEYIKFSSLWTAGPGQFRAMFDRVLKLEARQRQTIAPVDILVARIQMTLDHDRSAEIGRIDRPSLVIGANDDAVTPVYFAHDLHAAIRDSKLHILDGGGHNSYRQRPDEWNGVVESFLKEVAA